MTDAYESAVLLLLQAGVRPPTHAGPAEAAAALRLCLPDVTPADLMAAAMGYARSGSPFWPTPGQLLQRVPRQAEPTHYAEGWSLVRDAIQRVGYYGDIERHRFSRDPAVEAAVRSGIAAVGGWRTLCCSRDGDAATRAAFRDGFTAAHARARRASEDRQLVDVLGRAGLQLEDRQGSTWGRADGE